MRGSRSGEEVDGFGGGSEEFFELEFFEVAGGLVDDELVDAAVGFFAAGDFDGFVELGAAGSTSRGQRVDPAGQSRL